MRRRIASFAWILVALQVAAFLLLGEPFRTWASNIIQVACCLVAAAFCFSASRRSPGLDKTFWGLFAISFSAYGISNIIWTYYENWLKAPVPASSLSQFLYICYDGPIVMALFLREGEDPSGLDWQRSLDFVQMLMVAFLVYYDFLFLRALQRGPHSLEVMEQGLTNMLNFVLAAAFVARSYWGRTALVRNLCRKMSVYFIVYTIAAGIGDYALTFINANSGSWSSLAWTVPFIVAAWLAASYEPRRYEPIEVPRREWKKRSFLLKNIGLAIMPLTVLALALRASEERYRLLFQQLLQAEKMQAIGRLAGGVAHDFNNVLTVIMGYAQHMIDFPSPDTVHNSASQILTASNRAASLTRQLLAFGRKQILQPSVINLNAVIVDVDKMLRRLISENVQIVTRPATTLGCVKADIGQIEQVLLNLFINARDAMPGGGAITVETANVELDEAYANQHAGVQPGSYVMLAVSDTGIGMDEATKSHIFEPFFTTKEMGKGSGLGLATVYGVVQQSGGHVWVYSERGRGSTFKVYLPRVEDQEGKAAVSAEEKMTIRGSETILVAEDDRQVRDLTVAILKTCGYVVLDVENAHDAVRLCQQHGGEIHLFLTDVVMREMSGPELVRRLQEIRPTTKVLFMSGYTDSAIVHQGMLDPGIAFLPKPFTPAALAGKVRQVLEGAWMEQAAKV